MKPATISVACLLLNVSAASAATVLSTNFAAHATGAATAATLNAVTTGGTWTLITGRGATYEIQDSSGDKALLLDDPDTTGNNGVIQFAGIGLGSTIDLTTSDVTWDFSTAARRTGANKGLRFEFGTGATVAATIDWYSDGLVTLNTSEDSANDATTAFTFLGSWNAASTAIRDLSVTFSGTTVSATFGGATLEGTIQNSLTTIGRLRIYSIGSDVAAKGLFLDDISVTATPVPEPSAALLAALAGCLGITRRRR